MLEKRKALVGELQSRKGTVVKQNNTDEFMTFVAISDQNDGERFNWHSGETYIEILDVAGAKTDRLNTFFKDHNRDVDAAVGRVVNKKKDGTSLLCDVIFDESGADLKRKYENGTLTDVSIGYKINKYEVEERDGEPDIVTVTEFDVLELSAVGIGFDSGAKKREKNIQGDLEMNEKLKKELEALRKRVNDLDEAEKKRLQDLEEMQRDETDPTPSTDATPTVNTDEVVKAERERISSINTLVSVGEIDQTRANQFVSDGTSLDEVRKAIFDEKIASSKPVVSVGERSNADQMQRAMTDAMALRCGVNISNPHEDVDMFRNASLLDVARELTNFSGYDRMELAKRAMTSSDFTLLLGNVANRVIADSFEEQEGTYHLWTQNVELPDFRVRNEVALKNGNGRLRKIKELSEKKNIEFAENGEAWKLESYGEKFFLTREMIINDDLGVFTGIVNQFGTMSKRTANGLVYDLLQAKGDFSSFKMADGKAIFEATTHKNYTSSGTVLSSPNLTTARTAMRRQKDGAQTLNIAPKYLLVSPENEASALQILTSEADPSKTNSGITNIHKNSLTMISDSELDALPWYLAAGRNTIKTGTLQGSGGMPIVQQNTSSLAGTEFECVFDFGVMVSDFRGLYKNNGASS
jgi:uncharacterized protein (DUF849 family)